MRGAAGGCVTPVSAGLAEVAERAAPQRFQPTTTHAGQGRQVRLELDLKHRIDQAQGGTRHQNLADAPGLSPRPRRPWMRRLTCSRGRVSTFLRSRYRVEITHGRCQSVASSTPRHRRDACLMASMSVDSHASRQPPKRDDQGVEPLNNDVCLREQTERKRKTANAESIAASRPWRANASAHRRPARVQPQNHALRSGPRTARTEAARSAGCERFATTYQDTRRLAITSRPRCLHRCRSK